MNAREDLIDKLRTDIADVESVGDVYIDAYEWQGIVDLAQGPWDY